MVLEPTSPVHIVPTNVKGPLPKGFWGLILGRFSTATQGILIHPGVIDPTFQGHIHLLVSVSTGPTLIPTFPPLAQLVLVPQVPTPSNPPLSTHRRPVPPGLSQAYWSQTISQDKPMLKLFINNKPFRGLIDTGADVSVISHKHWPSHWPLRPSATHLQGLGYLQQPYQSSTPLTWRDSENNTGTFQPFVVRDLPLNLWGRDLLSQMQLIMHSPNAIVTKQMLAQGYLPGQGLGKYSSGITSPVHPKPLAPRHGLGYDDSPPNEDPPSEPPLHPQNF